MSKQNGMVIIFLVLIFIAAGCTGSKTEEKPLMPADAAPFQDYVDVRYYKDIKYGQHELQAMDLFLVKSDKPTPLIIYIHGGGFSSGDKRGVKYALSYQCFAAGISYASFNYRLSNEVSFPAFHHDCMRAVQFLRYHAERLNLDPSRFASTGGSAGAGISMWLAFKDDMADPESDDPIARQSTRLTCIAVWGGQSSYDPNFAESIGLPKVTEMPFFLPFYGIEKEEIDSPKAKKLYEEASAINYITSDDVPALLDYGFKNEPITEKTSLSAIIHHPKFGIVLKERMDELGLECILQYPGHPEGDWVEAFDFIAKHFGIMEKEME
jgi:hypothetical protein